MRIFSLHKILIDGRVIHFFVDYCDVFISCLDYHSDGTYSLQRIKWRNANFLFFKFEANSSIFIIIFIFFKHRSTA